MEGSQIQDSKKRSLNFIQAQELQARLKSKVDMLNYLDKHRRSRHLPYLTPL